jgi:hypothetical protein
VAATYGPLFLQGEYYWFNVDRSANTGLPPSVRRACSSRAVMRKRDMC